MNADRRFAADVLLQDGLIAEVAPGIAPPQGARVIDAAEMLVMPGGIDPHTHLEMPSFGTLACDDFYRCSDSASRSCSHLQQPAAVHTSWACCTSRNA